MISLSFDSWFYFLGDDLRIYTLMLTLRTKEIFKLTRKAMIKKLSSNSTLLCVSPTEIIPEKYEKYIQPNNNKNDWRILNMPGEFDFGVVRDEIYSIPRTKYIREITYPSSFLIWCAVSKDLGFPEGYSKEILEYHGGWIRKGNWSLFCLGPGDQRTEVIEGFKSILTEDIIFDYDSTIRCREIWWTGRRTFLETILF